MIEPNLPVRKEKKKGPKGGSNRENDFLKENRPKGKLEKRNLWRGGEGCSIQASAQKNQKKKQAGKDKKNKKTKRRGAVFQS